MTWKVIASRAIGNSHKKAGKPCQDYVNSCQSLDGHLIIGVVADGASSGRHSEQGAKIAVEHTIEYLKNQLKNDNFKHPKQDPSLFNPLFSELLKTVKKRLEEEGKNRGFLLKDLACTLLVFIATPDWIAAMQVGDGIIVIRAKKSDKYELFFQPCKGEYPNQTTFVTSSDAVTEMQTGYKEIQLGFIVLATDWCESIAIIQQQTWEPFTGFFKPIEDCILTKEREVAKAEIDSYLNSERVNQETDDDKTLLLCVWDNPQTLSPPKAPDENQGSVNEKNMSHHVGIEKPTDSNYSQIIARKYQVMSAELTSKIAEIIRRRKEIADEPKWEKERLDYLYSKISQLETRRQQFMRSPGNNTDLIERLTSIDFPKILLLIEQEQQVWENLWKRFSRETLNIGVAGLARQGKSTLLQKLTGLSDDEIPSSDRMPCTSVQSNIYHIPDGETYALVYFYSETSFLEEVIAPYYQKLGFASIPKSLLEFQQPLPPQPVNLPNPAEIEAIYKHLHDDYQAHIEKYSNLLQPQERVVKIAKHLIKKYVSQEYDVQGNPLNFNHLAVRKVEIFCSFPKVGVEKIGLIDTVGLGDTRLGDSERMIKALGQDTDFILFVRRPSAGGDLWGTKDINLYDAAYQALKDRLLLEKWSFMVLNNDGKNQTQCKDLENTRIDKGIRVRKCLIANCIDSTQSNSVLEKTIDYLVGNLIGLDREYMSVCKNRLQKLQIQITAELEKARQALEQYGEEYGEYVKLRDQFMKDLYNKIEELRHRYRQEPTKSDPYFQHQVDTAIEKCHKFSGIPAEDAIKSRLNQDGIDAAYFWCIQQMRAKLLKNFHLIETGLIESLKIKKSEIANVLCQLGISGITQEKGTDFLKVMTEQIPANLTNLKLGFQFLYSFNIMYKGYIQTIVWGHISKSLPPNTNSPISTPRDIKSIQEHLKTRHQEAVDSCKQALNILALAPSEIGCSMVEEFADHITRAEGVQQEWDIFLGTKRSQIWPQLRELEQRKRVQQEWMTFVDEVISINQKLGQ